MNQAPYDGATSTPTRRRATPKSSTAIWATEFSAFWLRHPVRRWTLAGLFAALLLATYGTQHFRVTKQLASPQRVIGVAAETVYLPPVAVLRMMSLGSQGFMADLLFIRVAHYFVDHLLSDSQLPFIDLYLDAIWGLDAHNRTTYRWGAQVIKFGQRIDDDVNRRANAFSRLGLEAFPHDPWLYHEIAYNLFAYRLQTEEPERARIEALSLRYLDVAYKLPGFSFDPNYLAYLYERAGAIDTAISTSMSAYALGTAEQRRELRVRLLERDRADAAANLAWLDVMRRRDWPFVSEGLTALMGPQRLTTPPQDAARPENWLAEPETPLELLEELDVPQIEPVAAVLDPGTRRDPAEWHRPIGSPWLTAPLPEPVTESAANVAMLPKSRAELAPAAKRAGPEEVP